MLQNALKFTFEGHIKVEVGFDNEHSILRVSVEDTGIGIKPEDRPKLFKLFGKLEDTKDKNTSGIGLGLSICKKIVQLFNGDIFLDPEYEGGCKFVFTVHVNEFDKENQVNQDNS